MIHPSRFLVAVSVAACAAPAAAQRIAFDVPAGTLGELVVTSLGLTSMPLIRYRMGDMAARLPEVTQPTLCLAPAGDTLAEPTRQALALLPRIIRSRLLRKIIDARG